MNDNKRIKKYLIIGLIGAVITFMSEISQRLIEVLKTTNIIPEIFVTNGQLIIWKICFESTIGAIGILLQFFGVYAIYLSFKNKDGKTSQNYIRGAYNYSFVGAIVHILIPICIYAYKIYSYLYMEFMIFIVSPILIIFLIDYIWFSIIMFNKIRKGETIFSKWCCLLNPVIGNFIFNLFTNFFSIKFFYNGISYSNIGVVAIVIFTFLSLNINKNNEKLKKTK